LSPLMMCRTGIARCIGLSIAVGSVTVWAETVERDSHCRIELLLTTAPTLPDVARLSMMAEAAAIWQAHGVAIDWLSATVVLPVSPERLRVLVVQRRQPHSSPREAITVGELLRPANGHPVAMVSIESAERLVASVRRRAGYDWVAVNDRRLGLVLGRTLAHEIGHYLLNTHTHASHGLMRPQFDAREFTDLRDGTFALDRKASEWLKSRAPDARFAYAN
jgi:hypothetical protein